MTTLLQTLVFGLLIGGVYALMSTGLTLVFGVMKIVNMAQGAFLVLGAYLSYSLWHFAGIDPLIGAFIGAPIMAGIGVLLYKTVIERAQRIDRGLAIVATFALALILESIIALIWGPDPVSATPTYFNQALTVGAIVIPKAQLYACILAVLITAGLTVLIRLSWLGRAITAASENPEGAKLVGVDPAKVGTWIFAIAIATTSFGGAALSFLYQFVPDTQDSWIGLTLSVVILGGLGSIPGVVAGGVALGLAEAFTSTYLSIQWTTAVPLILILLVLLVRPQGLVAFRSREDVAS
ncbi:branched-chain amino acid ABC transporter permease [Lysinimonas soli]|uniref:Branched-chain amino acid ABC transporter permease n=1 Tax=Lysinimonas soli TaxID=1074233 RepID=A0ABW0NLN3_9MICO